MTSKDNKAVVANWHFGIPVYEKVLVQYPDHAAGIVQHMYRLKDRDKGVTRSNQGGWHSSANLHMTRHIDTRWLINRLMQIATASIRDFEGDRSFKAARMVAAWANINHKGAWNAPHEHLPCTWSGVFYVDAGEYTEASPGSDMNGELLFFDPVPLGYEWKRPPVVKHRPETGKMLLFPSFLTHMVAPYYGEKPRISIAFNIVVDR